MGGNLVMNAQQRILYVALRLESFFSSLLLNACLAQNPRFRLETLCLESQAQDDEPEHFRQHILPYWLNARGSKQAKVCFTALSESLVLQHALC